MHMIRETSLYAVRFDKFDCVSGKRHIMIMDMYSFS